MSKFGLFWTIGPMHEEKMLGNTPKITLASFSLLKVGIPQVKINIFQRGSNGI